RRREARRCRGRRRGRRGYRRGRDRQELVVLVGHFLDEIAVEPHQGAGVVLRDVANLAAALIVPAETGEIDVRVSYRLREFVGADGGQLINGGGAQTAIVGRTARVGDDRIPDRLPVRPGEGAVIAEDALLSRALAGPEVHRDVRLHVDDVQPICIRRL